MKLPITIALLAGLLHMTVARPTPTQENGQEPSPSNLNQTADEVQEFGTDHVISEHTLQILKVPDTDTDEPETPAISFGAKVLNGEQGPIRVEGGENILASSDITEDNMLLYLVREKLVTRDKDQLKLNIDELQARGVTSIDAQGQMDPTAEENRKFFKNEPGYPLNIEGLFHFARTHPHLSDQSSTDGQGTTMLLGASPKDKGKGRAEPTQEEVDEAVRNGYGAAMNGANIESAVGADKLGGTDQQQHSSFFEPLDHYSYLPSDGGSDDDESASHHDKNEVDSDIDGDISLGLGTSTDTESKGGSGVTAEANMLAKKPIVDQKPEAVGDTTSSDTDVGGDSNGEDSDEDSDDDMSYWFGGEPGDSNDGSNSKAPEAVGDATSKGVDIDGDSDSEDDVELFSDSDSDVELFSDSDSDVELFGDSESESDFDFFGEDSDDESSVEDDSDDDLLDW
ncbi:hypothetical protein H4R35_005815 [Dimargaris xerosporica]|nr:hypothetical protein H4R35_005815 [Dimargaris xerosporica]